MHHFFEAITNTSGESLVGYFARVINTTTQGAVTLASDVNGTPIVTVSGIANMAKTDEFGNLSLYVAPGTYHLDIYAGDATTFVYRVPNIAMNSSKGDRGDPGEKGDPGDQGPPGVSGLAPLAASTGATLVGYGTRTVADKLGEVVSVKDSPFNARGIGPSHDDRPAIQAALDAAAAIGAASQSAVEVFIPRGRYTIYGPLLIPNYITITGEYGSIIDNQSYPSPFPLLKNKDPDGFYGVTLRDFTVRGGQYGLKMDVTGAIAEITMEGMRFDLQTIANVQANKLYQTSRHVRCYFMDAPFGFVVQGFTTNLVVWDQCTFGTHSDHSLWLNANEACRVQSCQFEGGAVTGRVTIRLDNRTDSFSVLQSYFESTHEIALKEEGSSGTTVFDGNHFTGAKQTGSDAWASYRFQSDGMINFGTNDFGEVRGKIEAPDALIYGFNNKLSFAESNVNIWSYRSQRGGKVSGKRKVGTVSTTLDVGFSRVVASGTQTIGGTLRVTVSGVSLGGFPTTEAMVIPFSIGTGSGNVKVWTDQKTSSGAGAFTFTVSEVGSSTTSATLRCVVAGNVATPANGSEVMFNLEWDSISSDDGNHLQVALP